MTGAMDEQDDGRAQRIAIFTRWLGGGGAERVMSKLANAFVAKGRRVDLVMGQAKGHYLDQLREEVRVVDLDVSSARPLLFSLPRLPWADVAPLLPLMIRRKTPRVLGCAPGLARYLARERPDALLCSLDYANFAGLLATRLSPHKPPLVMTVRNHLSSKVADGRSVRERRLPEIARHFYPQATTVAVSEGVARDLQRIIGEDAPRVRTIYNPVVDERLARLAAAPAGHPWLDEAGPPVALAVGRLHKQKDFPTLLRAFATVRRGRSARLVILGEGAERARLEALARDLGIAGDVALPGFAANPFAYMRRAALFVLSSRYEGLPNALLEALACGCPVVSTDCPSGPHEILAGGEYGRLVPVGEAEALAAAMAETLERPGDPAPRLRRAAEFSAERVSQRFLDLFDDLHRSSRRR